MTPSFDESPEDHLQIRHCPDLDQATLVLALSGWMDGGNVSTGTVERLVDILNAKPIAQIDPEPFYIYNFPGSMEVTALFRPHVKIEGGLVDSVEMPANVFYCHEPAQLVLFVGKEPHLRWRAFGECILHLARKMKICRIVFVGSFGGAVPHTREPKLYITCSDAEFLSEMEPFSLLRSDYEGPGSFTSYMMTQAKSSGLQMASLVAEIPGYLQGTNPQSIEAVSRRLAKILKLPMDLDSLRSASTEWELEVTSAIEKNDELAEKVRELEEQYDDDLLERNTGEA